ncbi:AAA family ATPase [Acinetobacter sp. NPDC052428]|uniref:AAA family ATPase n=1 Tax=Acinetobacter sp. NPDC052428 TaxID=3363890 RepID=UPI0037CAFFDA
MVNLHRITIKNFKIFDSNDFTINFSQNNLTILDGPNGYGKTSVFDAIELGLTGNISRLLPLENKQHPADVVVAHKQAKKVEIIIEFKDNVGEIHTFKRKLKSKISGTEKKISNFCSLWELSKIVQGEEIPFKQSELEQLFDSQEFSRDFLLFHYVQQEETARFLKTYSETKRADELSRLFGNTQDIQNKIDKFCNIKKNIDTKNEFINLEIQNLKSQYSIENMEDINLINSNAYVNIFPWLKPNNIEWNSEIIENFNAIKHNKFLNEINLVKKLIENREIFIKIFKLKYFLDNEKIVNDFLVTNDLIDNYEKVLEASKNAKTIRSVLPILKEEDLNKIFNIQELENLYKILNLEDYSSFEKVIDTYKILNEKTNGLASLYVEIIKQHDSLKNKLEQDGNVKNCYLCGHKYTAKNALEKAILEHGNLLRNELSFQDEEHVKFQDMILSLFIRPIVKRAEKFISNNYILSDEYTIKLQNDSFRDKILKIRNFFETEQIEYQDVLLSSNFNDISLSDRTQKILNRLLAIIDDLPKDNSLSEDYLEFQRIYRDIFENNFEKISDFNIDDLNEKKLFLENLYFSSLNDVKDKILILLNKSLKLQYISRKINNIVHKMQAEVRKYRKKLITDIEIPFFIYSGKILQSHQAGEGNGIFIKDQSTNEDQLRNIKLVADLNTDHDILNTMSSGQISAVVLALTLALNKVYTTKLSTILIDDPVQTMDDVNMSSLLELLRNDFSDKHVILSTHEDKVARYFTYKYLKFNKVVKLVNVMKREEFIPSNNYIYQ